MFWKLLSESTILQGLLSLTLIGTTCYLSIAGREIPDGLLQATMLVVGYFFGSKATQQVMRTLMLRKSDIERQ